MPRSAPATPVTLARLAVSVNALDLYRDLLGLDLGRRFDDLAWLSTTDGIEMMLHQRPSAPSDTAVAIGFLVSDVDDTVRRWVGRGGDVADPAIDRPWGERMAVVRDPDGHLVCLSSPNPDHSGASPTEPGRRAA